MTVRASRHVLNRFIGDWIVVHSVAHPSRSASSLPSVSLCSVPPLHSFNCSRFPVKKEVLNNHLHSTPSVMRTVFLRLSVLWLDCGLLRVPRHSSNVVPPLLSQERRMCCSLLPRVASLGMMPEALFSLLRFLGITFSFTIGLSCGILLTVLLLVRHLQLCFHL